MSQTVKVGSLDSTIVKTNEWLAELSELMGADQAIAYDALRATMTTVRDMLALEEAAHLSAELPMLLRGMYYTGWSPSNRPERFHRAQFLSEVARRGGLSAEDRDVAADVRSVFVVLGGRISPGELGDVIGQLPKDVQALVRGQDG